MYKDWFISGDQWEQENWTYKDGTMIHILHDNKCGTHDETPVSIDEFLQNYQTRTDEPFPEIIEFIKAAITSPLK